MKTLLLLAVVVTGVVRGDEPTSASLRVKLRTRIRETLPVAAAPTTPTDQSDEGAPTLVLEPLVIAEAKGVRELEKLLASEKERRAAEAFSLTKGGTIYRGERLELGSWWSPATGLEFLKIKW